MYRSAEHAQISAINQPMTVQPKSKFTMKMPTESGLCRPIMVGRKYRSPERIRKVIIFTPFRTSSTHGNTHAHPYTKHQDTLEFPVLFQNPSSPKAHLVANNKEMPIVLSIKFPVGSNGQRCVRSADGQV
jgi:hypothetical protein